MLQALSLAYGPDVARAMFTIADTIRTIRTVSELAGVSDANRETIIKGCKAGLDGLLNNLINAEQKK